MRAAGKHYCVLGFRLGILRSGILRQRRLEAAAKVKRLTMPGHFHVKRTRPPFVCLIVIVPLKSIEGRGAARSTPRYIELSLKFDSHELENGVAQMLADPDQRMALEDLRGCLDRDESMIHRADHRYVPRDAIVRG